MQVRLGPGLRLGFTKGCIGYESYGCIVRLQFKLPLGLA